jgi:dipeptidyl aminopeptidase/acylaminoacyl peptidase
MNYIASLIFITALSITSGLSQEFKLPLPWNEGNASPDINQGNKTHWFRTSDMKMAMVIKNTNDGYDIEIYELDKLILTITNAAQTTEINNDRFKVKNITPYPPLNNTTTTNKYIIIIDKLNPLVFVAPFSKKDGSFNNGDITDGLKTDFLLYSAAMEWQK